MRISNINAPRQRLPYSQKNKNWRKDNVDHGDNYSFYNNELIRKSLKNKILNLNLYNGIVDVRDLTNIVNPHDLDASFIPKNIPHHPILVPKIDLLVGEEIKRRYDYSVIVTNPDAITKKEEDKKKFLFQKLEEFYTLNYSEEELEVKMQELEKYMKYSWQDLREKMANQILNHYSQEQDFDLTFNKGFKDALIVAEEIYQVDVVHQEPTLEKLNPLKVHTVKSGNSDKIEDASMIILEDHWSPNRIIDHYHDQLKNEDIDYILDYDAVSKSGKYTVDDENHILYRDKIDTEDMYSNLFNIAEINGHYFGRNFTDEYGNIRVLKVFWKSLKKVKKIKFYNEFGGEEFKIASEEYIPNKMMGEEVTEMWVNEWWEGVKIGQDIYLSIKPRPIQYNKINNPSLCHPGIIGQVYNTNQGRAVSLVDRCKNYQYLFDAVWDRVNKAISTNYGKILEVDLAKIPDNWEVEKWMHFAFVNKIAVVDAFKEGKKGNATGKLAGAVGNTVGGRTLDMETGNYIQQHISVLEYIKMEMGEITGVSEQRQGQISNRETVGGIERSVNQSSHITEYWFRLHENVKTRVLTAFLETAKVALKGNNKKVQHILDDLTVEVLNLDSDEFCEADYGILVSSSSKTMELEQVVKDNAQAVLQNGGSLTTLMDIYFSSSLMDMRRKIEESEELMNERNQEASKAQNQLEKEKLEYQRNLDQSTLELQDITNQRDNETKKYIADLKNMESENNSEDGIVNPLDVEKLNLDREKVKNSHMEKMKALSQDMEKHFDNVELKKESNQIAKVKKNSN